MRIITAAAVAAGIAARYPNPGAPGFAGLTDTVDLSASAENVGDVQAAAVVGFQQNPGKLEWVKATEHFSVGAGQIVNAGDYAQVKTDVARMLVANSRAVIVTEDEVQKAQATTDTAKGKK